MRHSEGSTLEHSNWDEAIRHFDRVIRLGAGSEDGAHYWKAYAHYKDGRSREALETLAARREAFPDGRWSNDARALELEINESAGRPVDPDAEQNLEGGAKYLRWLMNRYEGRTDLALAAYNAGENAVDRYGGIPPYGETRTYVTRVLGQLR